MSLLFSLVIISLNDISMSSCNSCNKMAALVHCYDAFDTIELSTC